MRSGTVALCYNALYASLFLGIGFGLIVGRKWGYRLFWMGTALYSLDTLAFLLSKSTRDAYLTASGVTREVTSVLDVGMLDQGVVLASIGSLACWWGLAFFIYLRRDYFLASTPPSPMSRR